MIDKERLTKKEVTRELESKVLDSNRQPVYEGKIQVKQLANNTFEVIYPSGVKAIRYHHTDIITYQINGDIVLNSDGWMTSTTKERFGYLRKSGYGVQQSNKIWYLCKDRSDRPGYKEWTYKDGMIIHPNGDIEGAGVNPKELLKLDKSILKYVDGYLRALLKKEIPKPSCGDCWGCYMKDYKTGGGIMGNDHLLSHIQEKYYVPSLVLNAIETFPVSIMAKSQLGYLLGYHDQDSEWGIDLVKSQIRSSLRRYVQRQLGLAG